MDLNSGREFTYKSTQFPSGRSVPYACSWDVKVDLSSSPIPIIVVERLVDLCV